MYRQRSLPENKDRLGPSPRIFPHSLRDTGVPVSVKTKTGGKASVQSTKLGGGEQFLPQDCRAEDPHVCPVLRHRGRSASKLGPDAGKGQERERQPDTAQSG
jgi:hypothetical protein